MEKFWKIIISIIVGVITLSIIVGIVLSVRESNQFNSVIEPLIKQTENLLKDIKQ